MQKSKHNKNTPQAKYILKMEHRLGMIITSWKIKGDPYIKCTPVLFSFSAVHGLFLLY